MKGIEWYSAGYGGPKGKGKKLSAPCPTCRRPLVKQGKIILCPHCGFECLRIRVFILPDEHMEPFAAIFCWADANEQVRLHIGFVAPAKGDETQEFGLGVLAPMVAYWFGRLVKHGHLTQEQAIEQAKALVGWRTDKVEEPAK